MSHIYYEHALLVTNLLPNDDNAIVIQANALREAWKTIRLSIIHVITKIPTFSFQIPSIIDIQDQMYNDAKDTVQRLGRKLGIAAADQWVIVGSLEREVLNMADKLHVDLIVTGEKDDAVPEFLGGSVLNRLIHKAHCNVLCVNSQTQH